MSIVVRLVVCCLDWRPTEESTYWKKRLERLIFGGVTVSGTAIHIPRGDKKPLKKPNWTTQLSMVNVTINRVPWGEPDYPVFSRSLAENKG